MECNVGLAGMADLKSGEVVEGVGDAGGRESNCFRIGGAVSFSNMAYSYLFVNSDFCLSEGSGVVRRGVQAIRNRKVAGNKAPPNYSSRNWTLLN